MRHFKSNYPALQKTVFVLIVILGVTYIYYTWRSSEKEKFDQTRIIARSFVASLPLDALKALEAKPGDIDKPQYKVIKNSLKEIISINTTARFAYIFTERNDNIYYIADSESEESKNYSPPGQEHKEDKLVVRQPFRDGKEQIEVSITDKFGTWTSVLIPIKDKVTGKTIAVFGIDFDSKSWFNAICIEVIEASVLILLLLVVLDLLYIIKTKNKILKDDIAKLLLTEDELKQQKEEFEMIFNLAPTQIWYKDIHNNFIRANQLACNYVGLQENEINGHSAEEIFPSFAQKYFDDDREVLNSGKPKLDIIEQVNTDRGELKWVHTDKFPVFGNNGKLVGLVAFIQDITYRKMTEDALRNSEALLQTLVQTIPDLIWLKNNDGVYLNCNAMFERFFGARATDIIGKTDYDFVDKGLADFFRDHDRKAMVAGKPTNNEEWIAFADDGHRAYLDTIKTPMYDSEGTLIGVLGIGRDITERKQAEEALLSSENRLLEINALQGLLLSPNPITEKLKYVTDTVLKILDADFVRIWMIKPGDLCEAGCIHAQVTEGPHMCRYKDQCLHLMASSGRYTHTDGQVHRRVPFDCYKIGKIASGKEPKFLTNIAATDPNVHDHEWVKELGLASFAGYRLTDSTGTPLGVLALFSKHMISPEEDSLLMALAHTTSQMLHSAWADEYLIESEENFSVAFKTSPNAIIISRMEDGLIIEVNDAFLTMTGYTIEEVIGHSSVGMAIWCDIKDRNIVLKEIIKGEKVIGQEFNFKKKNGEILTGLFSAQLIRIKNKIYILSSVADISERVHGEQELIKAKEHAEESDRLKSAFLANMSHEIRTPMNGILGFAGLLKEPKLTGEEQQEYIGIIEQSGVRMLNIINDIVSISKIESGQMEVSIKETNINKQIEYIYTFFKPEAEKKGIHLHFKIYSPSKMFIIKTDREKIYAILTNLVNNALKFTLTGTIEFGYIPIAKGGLSELEFYVKDTGVGINPEHQKFIFERFRQSNESLNRNYEGSGLGLAITRAYVEMLGGKIWVESELGKGSTFYFTIPQNCEEGKVNITDDEKSAYPEENQIYNLKILIAEDDVINEKFLTAMVKMYSNKILVAKTGTEAVIACHNNPDIDLILMDIKMPETDGYEATRQIRQFNTNVCIIAQTAFALIGDREKALAAGCNDYISKPYSKAILKSLIRKHFYYRTIN